MLRASPPKIDLSHLQPVYVLTGHFSPEQLAAQQELLRACNAPLMDAAADATLFLGDITTRKRFEFELRKFDIIVVPAPADTAKIIPGSSRMVRLVRLQWLRDSLDSTTILKFDDYEMYFGEAMRIAGAEDAKKHELHRKRILEAAMKDREELEIRQGKRARVSSKERGLNEILALSKKTNSMKRDLREESPGPDPPSWVVKNVYPLTINSSSN